MLVGLCKNLSISFDIAQVFFQTFPSELLLVSVQVLAQNLHSSDSSGLPSLGGGGCIRRGTALVCPIVLKPAMHPLMHNGLSTCATV